MIPHTILNENIGAKLELSYDQAMLIDDSELRDLLYRKKILVFKGWHGLSPSQVVKFGQKFGEPWGRSQYRDLKELCIVDKDGFAFTRYTDKSYSRLSEGIPWHVDVANEPNMERYPSRILYCTGMPNKYKGLNTDVTNMAKAYDELSDDMKSFLANVYLVYQSWQNIGTNITDLPAIGVHPYTKERFLRFNAVNKINGWIRDWFKLHPDGTKEFLDPEVLRRLMDELGEKYLYSHSWEVGDLVIFDNWATMHRKGNGEVYEGNNGVRCFIRISINTGMIE